MPDVRYRRDDPAGRGQKSGGPAKRLPRIDEMFQHVNKGHHIEALSLGSGIGKRADYDLIEA